MQQNDQLRKASFLFLRGSLQLERVRNGYGIAACEPLFMVVSLMEEYAVGGAPTQLGDPFARRPFDIRSLLDAFFYRMAEKCGVSVEAIRAEAVDVVEFLRVVPTANHRDLSKEKVVQAYRMLGALTEYATRSLDVRC